MRWLMGERFCLKTGLKPEFVMGILREHVDKTHWQPGDAVIGSEPLFDRLTLKGDGRFVLRPSNELRRNGFCPTWSCELEGDEAGSRLSVRAGSPGTLLFCILLFGFFGHWGYSALRGRVPWGWFAGALGFALLFLSLGLLCFWLPERRARAGLQRILGGIFVEE